MLKRLKPNRIIWWVLLLALVLRLMTLGVYGLGLTLHSDDEGYANSAIRLLETGMLTYRGPTEPAHFAAEPTVKIMPGQPFLLAAVFAVFGTGDTGLYAAKILMILLGLAGIYGIYLTGKYCWGTAAGLIAAFLLAISIEHVVTDNLLLTESPFIASFIYLVYYSIRLANERKKSHFYLVVFFYLAALMFRSTIALYPLVLFAYLLLKKYPWQTLLKQAGIAAVIVLIALVPWWVRNYSHYHKFIPLTAGEGNPLLIGSYQGRGYPNDEPIESVVQRLKQQYASQGSFAYMEAQERVARERLKLWWETDKKSLIYSFAVLKPKILWRDSFYWIEVFHVKEAWVHALQPYLVIAGLAGFLTTLLLNKGRKELLFIAAVLLYFTAVYSVYVVFGRYNVPLMPFLYLTIATGLVSAFNLLKKGPAFAPKRK